MRRNGGRLKDIDFATAMERSREIADGALTDKATEQNALLHAFMMRFLLNCSLPPSGDNLGRLGLALTAGMEGFLVEEFNASLERR